MAQKKVDVGGDIVELIYPLIDDYYFRRREDLFEIETGCSKGVKEIDVYEEAVRRGLIKDIASPLKDKDFHEIYWDLKLLAI